MRALIVEDDRWVPEGLSAGALVRPGNTRLSELQGWLETRQQQLEDPLILAERVEFLSKGKRDGILMVRDQINTFDPVLVDLRDEAGRIRFVDMTHPYADDWFARTSDRARRLGIEAREGCLVGMRASELLTPAEREALRKLGGDGVCRWMHLETRAAAALGRKVLGIGVGTAVGDGDIRCLLASLVCP